MESELSSDLNRPGRIHGFPKQWLAELQAKLDQGRFDNGTLDNGTLNDVIDSIRKSSNDERLSPRDRAILSDDLGRLKDYQNNHNHWRR